MTFPEAPVIAPESPADQMLARRGFGSRIQDPAVLREGLDPQPVAASHAVKVDGCDDIFVNVFMVIQPVGTSPKSDLFAGEGNEADRSVQGLRPERPGNLEHHGDPGSVVVRSRTVGARDIVVSAYDDEPRAAPLLDADDVPGRSRSRIRLDGKKFLLHIIPALLQSPGNVVGGYFVVETGNPPAVSEHPDGPG